MPNPLTTGGRIVDVVLMAYAIVMIGAVVAVFNKAVLRGTDDLDLTSTEPLQEERPRQDSNLRPAA